MTINLRKEFFRTTISDIKAKLDELNFDANWTMSSEAREFSETQLIERRIAEQPGFLEAWLNSRPFEEEFVEAEEDDEMEIETA